MNITSLTYRTFKTSSMLKSLLLEKIYVVGKIVEIPSHCTAAAADAPFDVCASA